MTDFPLPEWLTEENHYIPVKDKDAFINKSILSFLKIISKIQQQGTLHSKQNYTHAGIKVILSFLLVLLISISKSTMFIYIINAGLLCSICLLDGKEIARILRNSIMAALFTALILLPACLFGNWHSISVITPKVFASVSVLSLLSYSTHWNDLTGALKLFLIPDIFIFVLDITIKYIFLLGEFSLSMLYALKLRSIGKNNSKCTSLSEIAGNMFLNSNKMAEEMTSAMACRGFTGEYSRPTQFKFNMYDVGLLAIGMVCIFLFINFSR